MSVTVVSRNPPGGRCTLYARYAEALSSHYNLTVDIHCPGEQPSDGPPPPSLVIRGQHVVPSDGVIVAPEDIVVVLEQNGLGERLDECRAELEGILDAFIAEMS